jgi:predicted amidohydrolase YtcJ
VTGRIATFAGDSGFGWVEAVGITGGVVAFAGSAVDLETRADPFTERFELDPDEIAIPGVTDAHLHLGDAAIAATQVDLSGAETLEAGLAAIALAAARLDPDAWIEGAGWDRRRWGRWPSAGDLERVVPGRLVALWSVDHHALWVSRAALQAAGIAGRTTDPPGGIVGRDPTGEPDGILLEAACPLVLRLIPPPTDGVLERAIRGLAADLLEYGIVGVHDPGVLAPDPELRRLQAYGRLADRGDLAVRVHASIRTDGLERAAAQGLRSGAPLGEHRGGVEGGLGGRGRAHFGWLKLFADGTLGSQTAALLERREGSSDRGLVAMEPADLAAQAASAATHGIATQIHAIGDAAVRAALDALEPTVGAAPFMPRLEHVQLCHPDDRARFGAVGIGASVQPVHLREDAATARSDWGDRTEANGYAWRSLLEAGAVLAFGTDAPVEPIDPWPGIALAVLRRDPSWGAEGKPFGPDEALTLEQALRAATVGPAALIRDPLRGRLVPGSPADLIVLPAAPSEPAERAAAFASVRPRLVLIDGVPVVDR